MNSTRLIETDLFPFEFLSTLGERESWRKEVHRPIYHVHKWWAKRLGSVFRGILLGCVIPEDEDLVSAFYKQHSLSKISVLDPFMGSGTTVGEAHKLGMTALGRDINPVAVSAAKVGLAPLASEELQQAFSELAGDVGKRIRHLYQTVDSRGRPAEVLYFFWVMQCRCLACQRDVDLFSSYVMAANAYPKRKPEAQLLCPRCGQIFAGRYDDRDVSCAACGHGFDPHEGVVRSSKATCGECHETFPIMEAVGGQRPRFRLYGKLVLTADGTKEYLPATEADRKAYEATGHVLRREEERGTIRLPTLALDDGYNTRQAMAYGFKTWREFFNDRQLLALGWLHAAIMALKDEKVREPLLTLFSGLLEFNNMFASYKGEGTGAVRHMFAHHILKPERTPLEANVWGTAKSSGSFSNLFRSRLMRAAQYQKQPTELNGSGSVLSSAAFADPVRSWPEVESLAPHGIYLSCGDSRTLGLPTESVDHVVTDPPFFDNVHYSELADFFYSWQQIAAGLEGKTTRSAGEVQDTSAEEFAEKLGAVLAESTRVLKRDGLLVFSYHHSREEGWQALSRALGDAGLVVVNCHPVKSEMSVATPKSQAKEPIQLDVIVVCRKATASHRPSAVDDAMSSARNKIDRLEEAGFRLSRNDRKVVMYGQLMTVTEGINMRTGLVEAELARPHEQNGEAKRRIPQLDLL